MQANEPVGTGLDGFVAKHTELHSELTRADVGHVRAAPGHLVLKALEHVERRIKSVRGPPLLGVNYGVAATHLSVFNAGQVERYTIAGTDVLHRAAQTLNAAHAHVVVAGSHRHSIVYLQRAVGEGSGDYGAAALGCEDSVDPKPWAFSVDGLWGGCHQGVESIAQLIEACASWC